MGNQVILLGKKTIWWRVNVILWTPFWFATDAEKRKSWDKFKYGLINHKHDYDYDNPDYELGIKIYRCKHFGCTLAKPDMS